MLKVEYQNYIPNSLRKNRSQAFQEDMLQFYHLYQSETKLLMPQQITVAIFAQLWEKNSLHMIFQCLSEQQNEQQFAQLCYQVIWKKYFYLRPKCQKVFALFCLYFLFFACENRNRIYISPNYAQLLKNFVLENRNDKNCHYMKVAFEMHQRCFTFATKIGLRNPIVKANGQPPRKPITVASQPLQHIQKIECELKEYHRRDSCVCQEDKQTLKQKLQKYDKIKRELLELGNKNINQNNNGTNNSHGNNRERNKFNLDAYFCNRVQRLIKNYKQFVYTIDAKKKEEQMD